MVVKHIAQVLLEDLEPVLETRGLANEWVGVDWRQFELRPIGETDSEDLGASEFDGIESPATRGT